MSVTVNKPLSAAKELFLSIALVAGEVSDETVREMKKDFAEYTIRNGVIGILKKRGYIIRIGERDSYGYALTGAGFDYMQINPDNKPIFVANLDENIGLPRIRQHAVNIKNQLDIEPDFITGGLDEYPITADAASEYLKDKDLDLIVVFGVPHAFPIEDFDVKSVAVTDGPRLVEPLRELGYTHVVAELDAHSKTLGTDEIVFSDFGGMIRSAIGWLDE